MLEKLLLAVTVTFSLNFLSSVNSPGITQMDWQIYSARKTTTELGNLADRQLLARIWQPRVTKQK